MIVVCTITFKRRNCGRINSCANIVRILEIVRTYPKATRLGSILRVLLKLLVGHHGAHGALALRFLRHFGVAGCYKKLKFTSVDSRVVRFEQYH